MPWRLVRARRSWRRLSQFRGSDLWRRFAIYDQCRLGEKFPTGAGCGSTVSRLYEAGTTRIARETAIIEAAGGKTFVIVPDETSIEAIGSDSLDARRGEAVAQAGFVQGKAVATEFMEFIGS